jgi:uncharacterized protein YcnI
MPDPSVQHVADKETTPMRLKGNMPKSSWLVIAIALGITAAQAHVAVLPRESIAGATEKYTMRVPDEKNIPTVRMEAEFPPAAEVISVDAREGWKIELNKDSSGKIIGAIWSGGSIAPREIAEFGFQARNPNAEAKLVWKVVQIYEDGSKSEWTGPAGSRNPASVTQVKPK